jgi:RHS repeat-associated protein
MLLNFVLCNALQITDCLVVLLSVWTLSVFCTIKGIYTMTFLCKSTKCKYQNFCVRQFISTFGVGLFLLTLCLVVRFNHSADSIALIIVNIVFYSVAFVWFSTAIIAGKDKTQTQQKRYRYTGKERDDSSGLSYYGARYLAPWLVRWISPDSAGYFPVFHMLQENKINDYSVMWGIIRLNIWIQQGMLKWLQMT